jgi:hypothetical protein
MDSKAMSDSLSGTSEGSRCVVVELALAVVAVVTHSLALAPSRQ